MNICMAVLLFLFSSLLSAQTKWSRNAGSVLNRPALVSIGLEGLFPSYNAFGFGEQSGYGIFLSGRVPFPVVTLVVEIPYASSTQKINFPPFSSSSSQFGIANPYVGVEFGSPEFVTDIGVRLPVVSGDNSFLGASLAPADLLAMERYQPKAMSAAAGISFNPEIARLVVAHVRVGPTFWIPTPAEGRTTEALLDYEGGLGAAIGPVVIAAGLGGRMILTEDQFIGNKKALHYFQLEIGASFGLLQPALFYRAPIEQEISLGLSSILGVVVLVAF